MSTATFVRNESFCLPVKVKDEKNQGIVSILGSDSRGTKPPVAASFRRTLSADMSSKKWLAQNGFSKPPTMKKVSSFAQLSFISAIDHHSSSSEEEEEVYGKKTNQNPKQDDVWSSILSQKKTEELPPPYVHPLLRKSSSSLCSKSLEICTESLGSETGSDKITLSQPLEIGSEANDSSKVKELSQPQTEPEREYSEISFSGEPPIIAKYNYFAASNKKLQPKSFPPPIPLLAGSSEGPSLHMHSHRENGRLVLEAVSVPSTKNFHAHRQDGRLRLTLIKTPTDQQNVKQHHHDEAVIFDQKGFNIEDKLEEVFDIFEKEENDIQENDRETSDITEEEINETPAIAMKQAVPEMARGMINVHRSAVMMKKIMGLENQNPTWSHKFNHAAAKLETKENNEKETATLSLSLPPRPRTTRPIPTTPTPAAASFNAYEYFWRTMPMTTNLKNPLTHCSALKNNTGNKEVNSNKPNIYAQQELLVLRNCRKARRSLLSWDGYCIATT